MNKKFVGVCLISIFIITLIGFYGNNVNGVMSKVQSNMKYGNYVVDGVITMDFVTKDGDESVNVPLNMNISGEVNGKLSHSVVDVTTSVFDDTVTSMTETYTDGDVGYSLDSTTNVWLKTDLSETNGAITTFVEQFYAADNFRKAKMKKMNDSYIIELKISDLSNMSSMYELFNFGDLSGNELFNTDINKALVNGKFIFTVDNQYRLTKITMQDVNYDISYTENDEIIDTSISMNMNVEFDKYNQVNAIEIPSDVLELATEVISHDNKSSSITPVQNRPIVSGDAVNMGDYFGSYNGVNLCPGKSNIDNFNDDFYWKEDDLDFYSFIPMVYKNNDCVSLFLYDYDNSGNLGSALSAIYGYELSVMHGLETSGELPSITFNGLTWGASYQDVKNVYGEPTFDYVDGKNYWSVNYDVSKYFIGSDSYSLTISGSNDFGANSFAVKHQAN